MLQYTQFLIFELGNKCNFSKIHSKCPILLRTEVNRKVPDEKIVDLVQQAYKELGFTGLVAWHFYNEPMLQWKRMIRLMETIRERVPESRFLLWTNGSILIDDTRFDMFEKVVITNYNNQPEELFRKYYRNELTLGTENFDDRIQVYKNGVSYDPCLRPFVEFIVAYSGDVHLCCQDWDNVVQIGNVMDTPLAQLVKTRQQLSLGICTKMSDESPQTCLKCSGRIGLPTFDPEIANRTFIYLEQVRNV